MGTVGQRGARGLLTLPEAAGVLGIDPFTLQRWIWCRKIRALRRRRRWLVPSHVVLAARRRRQEVRNVPTKRELQERVRELEGQLEEIYDRIGEVLDLEQPNKAKDRPERDETEKD